MAENLEYANARGYDSSGYNITSQIDFRPSSYTGDKSATTTVATQSFSVAAGATKIRVYNADATNFARVAFGISSGDAESNTATGPRVAAGDTQIFGVPRNATHFAYVGDTGTVTLDIQQGN